MDDVPLVLRRNGLRWCGHVLRGDDDGWVRRCVECGVAGPGPGERTWRGVVREDCRARGLSKGDAVDHCGWRRMVGNVRWLGRVFLLVPANPGSTGQKAAKRLCVCVCV